MKIDIRHEIPASAAQVWAEILSPPFLQASYESTQAQMTVLSETTTPQGVRKRRSEVAFGRPLPGPIARAMGSPRLTYLLEEEIEDAALRLRWRVIVEKVARMVDAAGEFWVEPLDEQRCLRRVQGEVKVAVPLLGRQIEQGIAQELERAYDNQAQFIVQWLQRGNPTGS